MSLQWTFVATFLYAEVFCVIMLLLPFISPARWNRIFKSRLVNSISANSHIFFLSFIVILCFLFADALREMMKYQDPVDSVPDMKNNPGAEAMMHMKLFRAQRNFYISGFALFLWFVLRRLVILISTEATLQASKEAAMKQAESASNMAKQLLEESDNKTNTKKEGASSDSTEVQKLKAELKAAREDLKRTEVDLETMKSQAESVTTEYDRLLAEHEKLQRQTEGDDKKDD